MLAWLVGFAALALLGAGLIAGPSQSGLYVSPKFFGQDLMSDSALTPAFPVHAMRLWDSNTRWCQIADRAITGQYRFRQLDALLRQASRLRADVEFTFGGTPLWATRSSYLQQFGSQPCSPQSTALPPVSENYWTRFVTALVIHARGRIHAYELWNEADSSYFWSGDLRTLVRMSTDAAAIIHRLDTSAVVLSPSISNTAAGYAFLRRYLSMLPARTVDAISVHSYTAGHWPEDVIPGEIRSVRSSLPTWYTGIPIWSTEGGWGENSQFSRSAADQRAFVARYDLQMLINHVTRTYWYGYPNSQWGTLLYGNTLTPAGIATRTFESWLVGAHFGRCTAVGGLWTCQLTTAAGKKAEILWVLNAPSAVVTAGYHTLRTLQGGVFRLTRSRITATREPVLLTS